MNIFKLSDFGAKADGITNDALALWRALDAAKDGGIVELEENKTYYIAPCKKSDIAEFSSSGASESTDLENRMAAIDLNGAKNLTIKGKSSKILLEKPLFYCNINYCENIVIDGLIFDYKVRPFVKAELVELNKDAHSGVFKTDRSLFINEETNVYGFGVLERPDGRYHMHMKTMTPVDADNFIYEIKFSDDVHTVRRLEMLKTHVLIAPVPNFAHRVERAFSITHNNNFTMKNCRVHSMARFGFALFCNDGTVMFDNVRVEKAPDEVVDIVGWRDCFHVKENHGKYIWNNCYAEYCYDDIFNISASTLNVAEVISGTDIDFEWKETHGVYPDVRVGDVVSIIDIDTGKDYGESTIVEIVETNGSHNHYRFDKPFDGIKAGDNIKAHVLNMVCPYSEITNCDFRGTFRWRGPIEIKDSHFYVARCWLDMCMPVEGPVPKHIHFTNCEFVCDDETEPYFHVVAQRKAVTEEPHYHIEDMVFENCKLPRNTFEIDPIDAPYVSFK